MPSLDKTIAGRVFFISTLAFYALSEGPAFGAMLGAYAGLFAELWSYGAFGVQIGLFSVLGALCGFLSRQFFGDSLLTAALFPVLCVYAVAVSNHFFLNTVTDDSFFSIFVSAFHAGDLILAALVSPFLFALLQKISPKATFFRRKTQGP